MTQRRVMRAGELKKERMRSTERHQINPTSDDVVPFPTCSFFFQRVKNDSNFSCICLFTGRIFFSPGAQIRLGKKSKRASEAVESGERKRTRIPRAGQLLRLKARRTRIRHRHLPCVIYARPSACFRSITLNEGIAVKKQGLSRETGKNSPSS